MHVGLESGCDDVLELINKGVTRAKQIEAGQRAKEAGFELSVYVMPGLGGRELSNAHADDTATALEAIQPDFIRLRTTTAVPGTELKQMQERGELEPLTEVEAVREIRQLVAGLGQTTSRLESDHMMNLLMELNGQMPVDQQKLLDLCDTFLSMPREQQRMFILGRRLGWLSTMSQLNNDNVAARLRSLLTELAETNGESMFAQLRARIL